MLREKFKTGSLYQPWFKLRVTGEQERVEKCINFYYECSDCLILVLISFSTVERGQSFYATVNKLQNKKRQNVNASIRSQVK